MVNLNKQYWNNRYNKMTGEKVVGHKHWSLEQYNRENEKWVKLFSKTFEKLNIQKIYSVLDFGCGVGRWIPFLKQYCLYYCGVDIIEKALNQAKEKAYLYNNVNFGLIENGLIPNLIGNCGYDLIWSVVCLQHVIDDKLLDLYISQFYKILRPNSWIISVENVSENKSNEYIKFRSYADYAKMFKHHKFKPISVEYFESSGEKHAIMVFQKI